MILLDCNSLKSPRMRLICIGCDKDGSPLKLPEGWREKYLRELFPDLDEIPPPECGEPIAPNTVQALPVSSIGTELERIIEEAIGQKIDCEDCLREVRRLNRMNAEQVLADLDNILDGIEERADKLAPHLWQWAAIKTDKALGTGKFRKMVRRWVLEAVKLGNAPPDATILSRPQNHIADKAAQERRLSICRECPTGRYNAENSTCQQITCCGGLKGKIASLLASCPDGHWGPEPIPAPSTHSQSRVRRGRHWSSAFGKVDHAPQFITGEQFYADIRALMGLLPHDIGAVCGIARSGLDVAAVIAKHLHIPLFSLAQNRKEVVACGSGFRIGYSEQVRGRVLLVDDTVFTGNSQESVRPVAEAHFGKVLSAAVYVNPLAPRRKPDLWVRELPWPHLLEWNLFNSILTPSTATDFDGVLCQDCPLDQDDDGPKYLEFLENAKPRFVTRRSPIPLIVTARLEKYRPQTEAWLRKWGVRWGQLKMGPWKTAQERWRTSHIVPDFKAEQFEAWARRQHSYLPPLLFIESDDRQSQRIASQTRRLVVCPTSGKCYTS